MRLTTLRPNRALLWKEWKGVAALYAVFFGMFTYISSYALWKDTQYYKRIMAEGIDIGPYEMVGLLGFQSGAGLWVLMFVVALAVVLTGLERNQKTYDLLLAMPYSRGQILHNKFVLGLALTVAVFVFNALVMTLVVAANPDMPYAFAAGDIWAWAGRYLVVSAFTFSFAMLIGTLSGTTLGSGILAGIFLNFPLGFFGLIGLNMDFWLSAAGAQYDERWANIMEGLYEWGAWLTIPAYVFPGHPIDLWGYNKPLIYGLVLAAALGSYLLAQYLFARNPMERNGEILMFGKLEGFFKAGVAVCFALLVGPMIISGWDMGLNVAAWVIAYLAVGAVFWFLTGAVINWRRRDAGGAAPQPGGLGAAAFLWAGVVLFFAVVVFLGVRVVGG